jgi:outer membrane protein assembly factor BamB
MDRSDCASGHSRRRWDALYEPLATITVTSDEMHGLNNPASGAAGGAAQEGPVISYAVNRDGTLRFKITTGGQISSSPAIASDGTVYFVSDDGHLYAIK